MKIALGFSNFIDKIIDIKNIEFNSLELVKSFSESFLNSKSLIDLLVDHLKGLDGKEYSIQSNCLKDLEKISSRTVIGGTSTRISAFLDSLHIDSLLHANSEDNQLTHAFVNGTVTIIQPPIKQKRVHYIIEYSEGDEILISGEVIKASKTDRIIFVDQDENPLEPVESKFFEYLDHISYLFVCSLNTIKSDELLKKFTEDYVYNIRIAKERNKKLSVFFEDCGHHNLLYKSKMMDAMLGLIDVYSCNETEIRDFSFLIPEYKNTEIPIWLIMDAIFQRYSIPVIIVHTKDYIIIKGEIDNDFIDAIKIGMLSATHWYLNGTNPNIMSFNKLNNLIDNPAYASLDLPKGYCVYPTKITGQRNGFTLGLGDCFIGGLFGRLLAPSKFKL